MIKKNKKTGLFFILVLIIIIAIIEIAYILLDLKKEKIKSYEGDTPETFMNSGTILTETDTAVSLESESIMAEAAKIKLETVDAETTDTENFAEPSYELSDSVTNASAFECEDKNTGVNIRSMPKHDSDLIGSVHNEIMYFNGESGKGLGSDMELHTWYHITTENGLTGWVRSDLVIVVNKYSNDYLKDILLTNDWANLDWDESGYQITKYYKDGTWLSFDCDKDPLTGAPLVEYVDFSAPVVSGNYKIEDGKLYILYDGYSELGYVSLESIKDQWEGYSSDMFGYVDMLFANTYYDAENDPNPRPHYIVNNLYDASAVVNLYDLYGVSYSEIIDEINNY